MGHDALGNEVTRTTTDSIHNSQGNNDGPTVSVTDHAYFTGTGQLKTRDQRGYTYDAAGNLEWEVRTGIFERASYYAASGQLRTVDYREFGGTLFPGRRQRTVERYRYDALGRRVWVWTQVQCDIKASYECLRSRVRRTVWDGSQELIEIQVPGDTANSALWERDTGGDSLAYINTGATALDPNPYFGQVVYAPGVSTDQPLSVTRLGYGDRPVSGGTYSLWAPFTFFPHWNYRGQPVFGSFADGRAVKQFQAGGTSCPAVGSTSTNRCAIFQWPAGSSAYDQRQGLVPALGWHGTLIENKRDGSGLDFKRNRVYDPKMGRFTQQDPIGLAGGLNLYGFANGDPVNFSDPFGLFCWPRWLCRSLITVGDAQHVLVHLVLEPGPEGTFKLSHAGAVRRDAAAFVSSIAGLTPGQANALRHLYGSCELARRAGAREAQHATRAHETKLRDHGEEDRKDSAADAENNRIGIMMGSDQEFEAMSCQDLAGLVLSVGAASEYP